MGQVPGEGEGGRREDKKCKAKGWKAASKRQRELNQKTKKEKEGKCLKDGTVGKSEKEGMWLYKRLEKKE